VLCRSVERPPGAYKISGPGRTVSCCQSLALNSDEEFCLANTRKEQRGSPQSRHRVDGKQGGRGEGKRAHAIGADREGGERKGTRPRRLNHQREGTITAPRFVFPTRQVFVVADALSSVARADSRQRVVPSSSLQARAQHSSTFNNPPSTPSGGGIAIRIPFHSHTITHQLSRKVNPSYEAWVPQPGNNLKNQRSPRNRRGSGIRPQFNAPFQGLLCRPPPWSEISTKLHR
jgi:hypothetical protein